MSDGTESDSDEVESEVVAESDLEQHEPAEYFHEDPYVHGVAQGLMEKYDLTDDAYSYIVYGMETPITEGGDVASDEDEAVAVLAIMPPIMPGGTPMPMEVPLLSDEDPYTLDSDAEDLNGMDIVAYYDEDEEATVTGLVVDVDEEEEMATLAVGEGDEETTVTVHTGGDTDPVYINGESLDGGFKMANDDDEHEKDWWRVEEFEEAIAEQETDDQETE